MSEHGQFTMYVFSSWTGDVGCLEMFYKKAEHLVSCVIYCSNASTFALKAASVALYFNVFMEYNALAVTFFIFFKQRFLK